MERIYSFSNLLRRVSAKLHCSDISLDRRLTVGSPSGLVAKCIVSLCLLTTVGVGQMWGASPHTCTFPSSGTITNSKVTVNSVEWTIATTAGNGSPTTTFGNAYSQTCIKFGSGKNNCYGSVTLSTNYFSSNSYTVTAVEVSGIGSATKNVTMSIGGSSTTVSVANNTWTSLSLSSLNVTSGLSIEFSLDNAGFFIHTITITYTSGSGSSYTLVFLSSPFLSP